MQSINHNVRLGFASLLAVLLSSYLMAANAEASETRDISKINSGIRIDENERVGDVSSVNGGIRIRQGAIAAEVGTVNGGIDIEDNARVDDAETVNGGIDVGENVVIQGSLRTVNGGIKTNPGTEIRDDVSTVNGKIRLRDTQVGADVETTNGDIEIRSGSVIEGDIVVKAKKSWFGKFFSFNNRPSDLVIDADSIVKGDIHLYKEVNLRIDNGAQVGNIVEHY
ncbi:MAG: hypothetical protein AB8B95_12615 [Pseudohongiellaceae bacterium]